jgi:hypothetical protein
MEESALLLPSLAIYNSQQAHTALGELKPLGFVHYQEAEADLPRQDRLIIQYESLHRLMGENCAFLPYDLVLLDEVRSVAGQICSPTNQAFLGINAAIFKALLRHSKCLLMDADLEVDEMVKILAQELWTGDEVEVHRYTHVALPRRLVVLELEQWMHDLLSALGRQQRIMTAFRTKKDMQTVLAVVRERFPDVSCLAFSSDSTASDMKAFQNINENMARAHFLCFTSKVTVGADIQTPFHQVFLHANSAKGCGARDMLQMLGRARNVEDVDVKIVLPPCSTKLQMATYEDKLAEVLASRKLRETYAAAVGHTEPRLVRGTFCWSPDWITRVLACQLAERDSDFTASLLSLARRKQYPFVLAQRTIAPGQVAALQQDLRRSKKRVADHVRDELEVILTQEQQSGRDASQFQAALDALERSVEQGTATREDQTRRDVLHVWQRFPEAFARMTLEDVLYVQRNMSAFHKLQWFNSPARQQDARWQDLAHLDRAPLLELAKMRFGQLHCVNEAAQTLGFNGVLDYDTEVPAEAFIHNASQTTELCNLGATLEGRRVQTQSRNTRTAARNAFQRELRVLGHSLKVQRRRQQDESRSRFYRIAPQPRLAALLPLARFATANIDALVRQPERPEPRVAACKRKENPVASLWAAEAKRARVGKPE